MSDHFRQRQMDRTALRSLVEAGGVPFRQNARSYRITCPKCGKQKLYIQKSDGRCKCMKCGDGQKGWADFILAPIYGIPQADLEVMLYNGVEPGTGELEVLEFIDPWHEFCDPDEVALDTQDPPPPAVIWSPDIVDLDQPAGAKGLAYLERRGIDLEFAKRYGVRYNVRERRVCFPVVVDGELRGWQARYIGQCEGFTPTGEPFFVPKIITTGAVGGRALMFQDRLKSATAGIMVEGPVDAMKCDLIARKTSGGVANTATMGKSFTEQQVAIYLRSGIRRLYIGLDDDAAERIMQVARDLTPYLDLFRLATPYGRQDLGASSPEEVYDEFRGAKKLTASTVFIWTPQPTEESVMRALRKGQEAPAGGRRVVYPSASLPAGTLALPDVESLSSVPSR